MGISPTLYNYAVDKATRSNIPLSQVISECANGYHRCNLQGASKHHMSVLSTIDHEPIPPLTDYFWIPTTLPLTTEDEEEDVEMVLGPGDTRQLSLFCLAGGANEDEEGENEERDTMSSDRHSNVSPFEEELTRTTEPGEESQEAKQTAIEEDDSIRRIGFGILIDWMMSMEEPTFVSMHGDLILQATSWDFEKG